MNGTSDATVTQPRWVFDEVLPIQDTSVSSDFDVRIVLQNEWWVDKDRRPHLLKMMKKSYLANVRNFILAAPNAYNDARIDGILREFSDGLTTPGDFVPVDSERLAKAVELDSEQWIMNTPLVVEIDRIISDHEAEGDGESDNSKKKYKKRHKNTHYSHSGRNKKRI